MGTSMSKGRPSRRRPKQTRPPKNSAKKNPDLVQVTEAFSGPLPPPDVLERYNSIAPGAADRIITMAEEETTHRRKLEQDIVHNGYEEAKRGQIFALFIGALGIIAGETVAVLGAQWAGAVIGGGTVVGLVSVFILGREANRSHQQDKTRLPRD